MSVWCYCIFCGCGFWYQGAVRGAERVICNNCKALEEARVEK